MKTIVLTVLLFRCLISYSLEMQWAGTTTVLFKSGTSSILIDPVLTRPSASNLWGALSHETDKKLVDEFIKKNGMKDHTIGLFTTHTHFDHAFDLGYFSTQLPKAKVFGSKSALNLVKAYQPEFKNFIESKDQSVHQAGPFKVTILHANHPEILGLFHFAPGKIEKPIRKGSILDFKMGGNFHYLIEVEGKKIYFFSSPQTPIFKGAKDVDVLFLGLGSSKSMEDMRDRIIGKTNPKLIIPVHWDNFFTERSLKEPKRLPMFNLDDFIKSMPKKIQKKIKVPSYFKNIGLN